MKIVSLRDFCLKEEKAKKGIQERRIEGGKEKERMIKQKECGHGNIVYID